MPRNGSGTYSPPGGTAAVSGATISSTAYNSLVADIGQEITASLPTTGVKAMGAALPMGGFQINNVGAPTSANDATTKTYVDTAVAGATGGTITTWVGGTSTGTANAQVVATLAPSTPAYTLTAGYRIVWIPGFTNTGATTLQPLALLAKNVFKRTSAGAVALSGGEIVSGQLTAAVYDGTQFILDDNATRTGGVQASLASAGTCDLGTIPSRNVNVTGTTTITSFGSSAQTGFPIYYLLFAGALTLTHNASSLILPGGANITTAAGDTAEAMYLGSGNWRVIRYTVAANPPGGSAATQAQQEAASSNTVYVTPGTQQFHPASPKAWGIITYSGGVPTLAANYGVASIADTATATCTVTLSTAFSSSSYAVVPGLLDTSSRFAAVSITSTTVFVLHCWTDSGSSGFDPLGFTFSCFGDLP